MHNQPWVTRALMLTGAIAVVLAALSCGSTGTGDTAGLYTNIRPYDSEELKREKMGIKQLVNKAQKLSRELCGSRFAEDTNNYEGCVEVLTDTYITIKTVEDMAPLEYYGRGKGSSKWGTCEDSTARVCSIFRRDPNVQEGCLANMRDRVCRTDEDRKYGLDAAAARQAASARQ